ncbi:MAG: hypothetical protein JRH12_17310 [Deltaproteobacteria bacterium]|nr:hypothetical protein [Deltaproteobacteria bacterium]
MILPAVALLVCAAMTVVFWPGVATWEVIQFEFQRNLPIMNDWKSPFVAYIYWIADYFFESTGPVLLTQQLLFWAGLALLTVSAISNPIQRVFFFLVVAALPLVWISEILLWKEAWTMSLLMLSMGGVFAYLKTGKPSYALIGALGGILLTLTRQNALLLAMPTCYVGAQLITAKLSTNTPKKQRLVRVTAFFVLVAVALSVNWAVNKAGKERCHIYHHAILWDLAAISLYEGKILIPEEFRHKGAAGSLKRIRAYFNYYNSDPLFYSEKSPLKLYGTAYSPCDQGLPMGLLLKTWTGAIGHYPGTYLRHRLMYIVHLLGITNISGDRGGLKYYPIDSEFSSNTNRSPRFDHIRHHPIYKAMASGRILPGWTYVAVFLLSGFGLSKQKYAHADYLRFIWLGGLAYLGTFLLIGSGAVLRYISVFAVLGPALLAGRRLVPRHPQADKIESDQ